MAYILLSVLNQDFWFSDLRNSDSGIIESDRFNDVRNLPFGCYAFDCNNLILFRV